MKETVGDFENRLNGDSIKNKDCKEVVLEFDGPDTCCITRGFSETNFTEKPPSYFK